MTSLDFFFKNWYGYPGETDNNKSSPYPPSDLCSNYLNLTDHCISLFFSLRDDFPVDMIWIHSKKNHYSHVTFRLNCQLFGSFVQKTKTLSLRPFPSNFLWYLIIRETVKSFLCVFLFLKQNSSSILRWLPISKVVAAVWIFIWSWDVSKT